MDEELAQWAEQFQHASDTDPELQAHGKFYSCAYLLDMEECRVLVKMHHGLVEDAILNPGDLDERYQFAIRASAETWRKFTQRIPEPMYHGLWAATFRSGMTLEGDILVMMQNLRCLTRQLELLRITGTPLDVERRH